MNTHAIASLLSFAYPDGLKVHEYPEALKRVFAAYDLLVPRKLMVHAPTEGLVVQEPVVEPEPVVQSPTETSVPPSVPSPDPGVKPMLFLCNTEVSTLPVKDPNDSLVDTEVLRSLTNLPGLAKKAQVVDLQHVISQRWPSCSASARVKQSLDRLVRRGKIKLDQSGSYATVPAPATKANPPLRLEIRHKVLSYMEKERVGSLADIAAQVLGYAPAPKSAEYDRVAQCLSRMVREGSIVKVKQGVYAATKEEADVLRK